MLHFHPLITHVSFTHLDNIDPELKWQEHEPCHWCETDPAPRRRTEENRSVWIILDFWKALVPAGEAASRGQSGPASSPRRPEGSGRPSCRPPVRLCSGGEQMLRIRAT